ncbi:unnamed protein product [Paramecium primaurelia]|uniref:Uncharacterized protein n=1 Tax=Paramecium primaurelia TaxID=5886 RepID=A0A8S1QHM6_PARPR|nr:unnamed protein product [Paramecium primaurelia]
MYSRLSCLYKQNKEMCKEDIMNLKGIYQHHKMYKYYCCLNMSYKKYHKLSKQFQQQNNDPHKFNIQSQMCKQHTNQGKLSNLIQIYKTLESKLSKEIHCFHYKLGNQLNMHHIDKLQGQHKILAYTCYITKELCNLCNSMNNSDIRHLFQLILNHNSKLLKQYKVSLHKQFIKMRQTLNMQSHIKNNNIIYNKFDDVIMVLYIFDYKTIYHFNQLLKTQINCHLQISTQNFLISQNYHYYTQHVDLFN